MKARILLTLMLVGGSAYASNAVYEGPGHYSENGVTRDYIGRVEFSGDKYISSFSDGNKTVSYKYEFKCRGANQFDVLVEGVKRGEGECKGDSCHYNVAMDSTQIDETLELSSAGQLHRQGTASCGKGSATWEDSLTPQAADQFPIGKLGQPLL